MSDTTKYTVGWICAIMMESVAAGAFLDEEHPPPSHGDQQDNNTYVLGSMGGHNVVIAALPDGEYGTNSAAAVARDMLRSFPNVRIGLMVGVGGGAPSSKHDIRLGDVVVTGGPEGGIFQYDFGKRIQDQDFKQTGHLNRPPMALRTAVSTLQGIYERKGHQLGQSVEAALKEIKRRKKYRRPPPETDRLYKSHVVHPHDAIGPCDIVCGKADSNLVTRQARDEEEDDDPAIHYGLIASGNQLMKDAHVRDMWADSKNVLCFEMEAAGLMNHFPCLVVRGICDYSDSHKNEGWQGYAAMVAAAYAKDLLLRIAPSRLDGEARIVDVLTKVEHGLEDFRHETQTSLAALSGDLDVQKAERWLDAVDASTNYNQARAKCHPATGKWFLDSKEFSEWKGGSRRCLWLHGFAGCGKTVLSSTIVQNVGNMQGVTIASFYFDFTSPSKQTFDGELERLYHRHGDGSREPDTQALVESLQDSMRGSKATFIILDALDECAHGERRHLLRWLETFLTQKLIVPDLRRIQLLITGRPEPEFERCIPIWIDPENCLSLNQNARLPESLQDEIRIKVGAGAKGMFRWAECQLKTLATRTAPEAMETALTQLPKDLGETYKRMIDGIPKEMKNDAIRLLQPFKCNVVKYCAHLVRIRVHSDAITFTLSLAHFSVKEYLLERLEFNLESASAILGKTCINYLEDIKDSECHPEEDTGLYIHETMAYYAARTWTVYYMSAQRLEDPSLIERAIAFVDNDFTYLRWFSIEPPYFSNDLSLKLHCACVVGLFAVVEWLLDHGADVNAQNDFDGAPLQAASGSRFEPHLPLMSLFLDRGADVNARGGRHGIALNAASATGNRAAVALLLDRGADLNPDSTTAARPGANLDAEDREHGTALVTAALGHSRDSLQIVRMLLENGADVNLQDDHYGTTLQAAASRDSPYTLQIVRMLLENGADVNLQCPGSYGTALRAAALGGSRYSLQIIHLLLENGADVNLPAGYYGNVLQAAASNSSMEIVQTLLNKGADINAKGGHYGSALQAACLKHWDYGSRSVIKQRTMIELLLERGADVNAHGGEFGSPLQAICAEMRFDKDDAAPHCSLIKLLLDKGANVNVRGGKYRYAPHAACSCNCRFTDEDHLDEFPGANCKYNVVKLLLENGANVNARGGIYDTALQVTSFRGLHSTVGLLLQFGADINARGGRHGNALLAAMAKNRKGVVELLLESGFAWRPSEDLEDLCEGIAELFLEAGDVQRNAQMEDGGFVEFEGQEI
ncbi:ankyrin repeat-containing domain protein [Cladorrhinum sp. PSN332]|nr:ankyrin repeat-containing domain protein [Cladorrhinum sp. PSN332]